MSAIEIIPSTRRLIRSLRDMGYDFAQAVADVVDNSISAGATMVAIDVEFDGDDSWIRIADNGKGMKPDVLREAMRFGAEREYEDDDLGKFGLGLKTASLSQCECLSVASRWNRDRADIAGYSWDLAHIEKSNRWEIIPIQKTDLNASIRDPLKDRPGTVVLWKRLDRLLGYKHPYGEVSRKRLMQMCREVEVHLAMVFHRFLAGETSSGSRRKFKIMVNGNVIAPWDPFCRTEAKTQRLQPITFALEHEGVKGEVMLDPFVLPPQHAFSSDAAFKHASGPANWNQQQGFYIYRADRMIQSGGWSGLRAPDEHTKLARVAIRFSPELDDAFKINVAKMRVQLPTAIRESIRHAVAPAIKLADDAYRRKPTTSPLPPPSPPLSGPLEPAPPRQPETPPPVPPVHVPNPDSPVDEAVMTSKEWASRLLKLAHPEERPVVERVIRRLHLNGTTRKDAQ